MPFAGELAALLTAAFWSGSAVLFGLAVTRVSSIQVNIIRLAIAMIYLGVVIAVLRLNTDLSRGQVANLAISGVIGLALGDTFLFKAFREIGPRVSMLIMALAPGLAAVLAAVFLGEELGPLGFAGIVITIIGVSMVVLERNRSDGSRIRLASVGLAFGVLAAAGQGIGLIFAKLAFMEGEVNGFVATMVRIAASLVVLLPLSAVTGRLGNPVRVLTSDRKAFYLLAAGSVFGPFLGISFSLIAVANTSVGVAAALMGTVPVVMLPMMKFLYRERLSVKAVSGALVAVAGIVVLFLR